MWRDRTRTDARVYFAHARRSDLIKIGTSTDVEQRLRSLALLCGELPVLLATVPGSYPTEECLHRAFASARTFGEWFHRTPELDELVRVLREEIPAEASRLPSSWWAWVYRLRTPHHELASPAYPSSLPPALRGYSAPGVHVRTLGQALLLHAMECGAYDLTRPTLRYLSRDRWASGETRPNSEKRALLEAALGIPAWAWSMPHTEAVPFAGHGKAA